MWGLKAEGGYAAADHLYSHGCRHIAFVGGFPDSSAREERRGGVATFLADRDLHLTEPIAVQSEPLRPESRELAMRLLTEHPESTASSASATSSHSASSMHRRPRQELGIDVRVIGFDDVHDAGLNRPSLSSVAVPARETGRRAAELVLERASGSTAPTVREELPTKLQPRETCGCPRPPATALTIPLQNARDAHRARADQHRSRPTDPRRRRRHRVSSSSGLGCPDAILEAIGQRYARAGSPANLTTLHPIAAGDMYGIKGIDHLCRPGQLRRVVAGSLPLRRLQAGSTADPTADPRRSDPGPQHPVRCAVPDASRRGHRATGRADRGRPGHLCRSPARGGEDERRSPTTSSS